MLRSRLALACLWLLGVCGLAHAPAPVYAEDEAPRRPPTIGQAADEVLRAVGDPDALGALIQRTKPDPWLVVEVLCQRGEVEAAKAFAALGRRPAVAKLEAYVLAKGASRKDDPARDQLARFEAALKARDVAAGLAATAELPKPWDAVTRLRLVQGRGMALEGSKRVPDAARLLLEAAQAAEGLGWLDGAVAMYQGAARLGKMPGLYDVGVEALTALRAVFERVGDKLGAAVAAGMLGDVLRHRGEYADSIAAYKQALVVFREIRHRRNEATVLGNMGVAHDDLGDYAKARELQEAALKLCEAIGDKHGMARAIGNLGNVAKATGDYPAARDAYERALEMNEALGHTPGIVRETGNIGRVHALLGHHVKALRYLKRGLQGKRELGDVVGALRIENEMASAYMALGQYAEALELYERVVEAARSFGHKSTHARTLGNLAVLHRVLGDPVRATQAMQAAHDMLEAIGDRPGQLLALKFLGQLLRGEGDLDTAEAYLRRAHEGWKALGVEEDALLALGALADVALARDPKSSLPLYDELLAAMEARGNRSHLATFLLASSRALEATGDRTEALARVERALKIMRRLRETPDRIRALGWKAELLLRAGDARGALHAATTALRELEEILGGLGEEQSASARATHADVFEAGAEAALRLDRTDEALRFLESGRAGALLESLGGRDALRWTDIPPELAEARALAEAEERQARRAHAAAIRLRRVKAAGEASKRLAAALDRLRSIGARFQREAKRAAGLVYPRAAPVDEIQDQLHEGHVLVVYGFVRRRLRAILIDPDAVRHVDLGKAGPVLRACASFDASDLESDPAKALAELRSLLVAPLGLTSKTKQVLISPAGRLAYVPFGALFGRPVMFTPSGTTHVLLAEEERRGAARGVLALGDPDYAGATQGAAGVYVRGRTLAPLPASRVEAKAIGSTVLLGGEATKAALRDALDTSARWRAVHFACHGLIDPERPTLSSLALSATEEEGGFLTALDVLRMDIRADLAVLSACETGRGRIVKGEGIVGLTRSFMYAGAPRVLCSLWKVDDEATQALMRRFYELWNPKEGKAMPAAEALRRAQEHVRGQSRWAHPYYWAAWVLWGLPD